SRARRPPRGLGYRRRGGGRVRHARSGLRRTRRARRGARRPDGRARRLRDRAGRGVGAPGRRRAVAPTSRLCGATARRRTQLGHHRQPVPGRRRGSRRHRSGTDRGVSVLTAEPPVTRPAHEARAPRRPWTPERVAALAVSSLIVVYTFLQAPGRIVADTKLDLYVAPGEFLRRALHLWDSQAAFG